MPCLEITLPKQTPETRAVLARQLTIAFAESTGHPPEIFGIRFFEYEAGYTAVAGEIDGLDSDTRAPYLHALLYCPRLKRSVKAKLATALTSAFANSVGNADWKPTIHICEHPYDNIVVGGKLLSDAYASCAQRKFYFDLPKD